MGTEMGKIKKSRSGSGMFIPDISEIFKTIFGLKILNYLLRIRNLFDSGSGMEKFGSGLNFLI
jgi:hypothetical protein